MESPPSFSHSPGAGGKGKLLRDHLLEVASRARFYASAFAAGPQAELAALTHDIGKYAPLFQRRLEGKEKGLDHWTVGACASLWLGHNNRFQTLVAASAAAVLGHHIGLQRADEESLRALTRKECLSPNPCHLRFSHEGMTPDELVTVWEQDGFRVPDPSSGIANDSGLHSAFLNDIRFVFSALVDADFVQTDAHFRGQTPEQLGRDSAPPLDPHRLLQAVNEQIHKAEQSDASDSIRLLRETILSDCISAAALRPGLFSLTAPTGSGKTLAVLRFAAEHAAAHNLRRIIYVAPYLTIVDQTVRLICKILLRMGMTQEYFSRYLLEHASLTRLDIETSNEPDDPDNEKKRSLQARFAENWDAPFVCTTNVQLLESLFSNRPSKCRKLHRLANSVIVLDEVQSLPVNLAAATLATLARLAEPPFGCTLLFMTATQPAFESLNVSLRKYWKAEWSPVEIVRDIPRAFALAKRFRTTWPQPSGVLAWSDLALTLASLPSPKQALVIVNVKRHAAELLAALPSELATRHLSTSMCPQHRKDVLEQINRDLSQQCDCVLVATQCVEAGVDLDFPHVYRAMAPLDSVAQAAGRCNRHGNRRLGEVHIFESPDKALPPDRAYNLGTEITRAMLRAGGPIDLDDPQRFQDYYRHLYNTIRLNNPNTGDQAKLYEATNRHDFVSIAELYRLIDDNTVQVIVPYNPEAFAALEAELHSDGFSAAWIRRARPYTVNVFRKDDGMVESVCVPIPTRSGTPKYIPDWFLLGNPAHYDPFKLGLTLPKPGDFLNA